MSSLLGEFQSPLFIILAVPIILGTTATDAATALSLGDAGLHADNFILLETFA